MPDSIARYYVLVREDLPIYMQIIQVAHACVTAGARFGCPDYHHLILLGVPDESGLYRASEAMDSTGIRHVLFEEPDIVDADEGGRTAICTEPIVDVLTRKMFREFRMWGKF